MNWTYKILDLPPVPRQFQDLVLPGDLNVLGGMVSSSHYKDSKSNNGNRPAVRNLSTGQSNVSFPRYWVNQDFEFWVLNNITARATEIAVGISGTNGGSLGPHTDRKRDCVLMFVVDPGGQNTRTVFWQEKDQDLIRNRFTYVDNYARLTKIDEIRAESQQWILLNSRILHSVEDVDAGRSRISFHVSLPRNSAVIEQMLLKERSIPR